MQREGFGIRLGAAVIDTLIMVAGAFALMFVSAKIMGPYVAGVLGAVFALGYSSLEIFKAATPGKMILKLQILDEAGNAASRELLVKRWAVKHANSILGLVAALTTVAAFNWVGNLAGLAVFVGTFMCLKPHRQAWHDTFAKTAVYRQAPAGFQVQPLAPQAPAADATPVRQAA